MPKPNLSLRIPENEIIQPDNSRQTIGPILTVEETQLIESKLESKTYELPQTDWKEKRGFTLDENGKSISCSVQFNFKNNIFRKIYKYDCKNKSFIHAKLYAEVFFQQTAYKLLNEQKNKQNSDLIHVFIPQIYKYGELIPTNGVNDYCYFYIDMEDVKLPTLQKLINPKQDDSIKNPILQQLEQPKTFDCNPIDTIVGNIDEFLKTNNIFHNDLKPDNIMINIDTTPVQIYIIDFGEARKTNKNRSGKGSSTPISVCGGKQTRRKLCKPKRARCHRTRKYTKGKKRVTTSRNNRKHRH